MKHDITLLDIIDWLKKQDQNKSLPYGFGEPMSYRGDYYDLAFEPVENAKISDMLKNAESALGNTYFGYKGGEFKMDEYSKCWIAEYGISGGQLIGWTLLKMWGLYLGDKKG